MRQEMLTQRAPFCIGAMAKKGHAESAFHACQNKVSTSACVPPARFSSTAVIRCGQLFGIEP